MMSLHGFIALDKPLGMSSAAAVNRVKHLLGKKTKIGHAGTLDPLASGVLVLALGEATKLVHYAQDAPKEYAFTTTWGQERSTDDAEGEVVATSDKRPTLAEIEAMLPQFIGDIQQAPPAFSAIKMGGKRAYAMARAGESPEMLARGVWVEQLIVNGGQGDGEWLHSSTFLCGCGKGTYIRSLARDMGRVLGVYGYVSMLRRTKVGKFPLEDAISLEKLEELVHKDDLGFIRPPQSVLDDILAYRVSEVEAAMLRCGQCFEKPTSLASDILVACVLGEKLIALGRTDARFVRPERVFNIV